MITLYEQIEKGGEYQINCFLIEGEGFKDRAPQPFELGIKCRMKSLKFKEIGTIPRMEIEKDDGEESIINYPIGLEERAAFIRGYETPLEKVGRYAG